MYDLIDLVLLVVVIVDVVFNFIILNRMDKIEIKFTQKLLENVAIKKENIRCNREESKKNVVYLTQEHEDRIQRRIDDEVEETM